jgi:hypothetical protein
MYDLVDDAGSLGKLQVLNWLMFALELIAAAFGAWHLWHETYLLAAQAFIIEMALIVIHALGISVEKRMHRVHETRVDRLGDEVESKAQDLTATADRFGLRIMGFFRRFFWW